MIINRIINITINVNGIMIRNVNVITYQYQSQYDFESDYESYYQYD